MPTLFSSGRNLYSPSLLIQDNAKSSQDVQPPHPYQFTRTWQSGKTGIVRRSPAPAEATKEQARIVGNAETTLIVHKKNKRKS